MTLFVFSCLLHLILVHPLSSVAYLRQANTEYPYGLPELTRDILTRIKLATGQPINPNRFFPILAASSKDYEVVEYQPYTKTTKYSSVSNNNKLDGGHYHINKGDLKSGVGKNHFYEVGEHQHEGKEVEKHKYDDREGNQQGFSEERFYTKNHHKSTSGKKGGKSKKGRKRGKFHLEKGFRDIYHKDEEKKSDFYWNNKHEEGKWVEYGFKNRKTEKSNDKGKEGKKSKDKTEESSYEKKENKCTKCKT